MDYNRIIDTIYGESGALRTILITHSKAVADKAMSLITMHPELCINKDFVYEAAMLHDIGIISCDAAGIECYGTEPYIRHGVCGAELLKAWAESNGIAEADVLPYMRVCERHTGAGLTKQDIMSQHLPLPAQDLLPETIEEKLICYADKFFSKTRVSEEKTFEHVLRSMQKFGDDSVNRFMTLYEMFS